MISLRPYQAKIVADIRDAFKTHRRVLLVSPTGSGKTIMFSYLAQAVQAKDKRVYILVHRDELVEQVSATLKAFGVEHGFIAAGRPVSTHHVLVCSVFTLANRVQDYKAPDLLIIDEAHHATHGSTWARVLGYWANAYRLGVTATPIRLDGRDLTGQFDVLVEGPAVGELIGHGDLCAYRMYTPPVVLGQLRMRMGDFVRSDASAAMDKPTITGDAVSHYTRLASGKRALVFCVSLEHAEHTAEAFRAAGYNAQRIDGKMDRNARRALVNKFSHGAVQVMTSCDLVSEGFDLPAIEVAILLRPTASLGLYLQQVGRSLRVFPGKEYALILDHAGNAGRHGLPDDEREWSLGEDRSKKSKSKGTKPVFAVRTCKVCYAASRPRTLVCPHCNTEFPPEPREVTQKPGELVEVDVMRAKIDARREVGLAKGLDALVALEKQRGYRPGWAMHVWGSRGRRS